MRYGSVCLAALLLVSCSGGEEPDESAQKPTTPEYQSTTDAPSTSAKTLQMFMLDCGLIDISDLDGFSTAGDYAGIADTFASSCWLIQHPKGNLLWDLGLPTGLVGNGKQKNGVFTLSMERTLSDQLVEIGLFTSDVDTISISHSHFDHSGQADQFQKAKWLVHADEYAAMFPTDDEALEDEPSADESDADTVNPYLDFAFLERQEFTSEHDVFGDGSVIIISTPGHTPGHTSLFVDLPETGPVFLTGDLYHRRESRELKRVPRFNFAEEDTLASMQAFEARVQAIGARVIIQHDLDEVSVFPKSPEPIR